MVKQSFVGKGAGAMAFEWAAMQAANGRKVKLYKQSGKWWIEYV